MKINTLCIFGTCPEAIKMAPVIRCLELDPRFHNQIGVIEQQLDKMQSVLDLYHIKPDHRWNMTIVNQDFPRLTARILLILTEFFEKNRPDYVLVVGDTVTALTAAIAAYYFQIPIGHIGAGLRAGDHYLSRSQEANRKLVGHLANVHFAATFSARHNLLREGIASDAIYVTGSTAMDALSANESSCESLWRWQSSFAYCGNIGETCDEAFGYQTGLYSGVDFSGVDF